MADLPFISCFIWLLSSIIIGCFDCFSLVTQVSDFSALLPCWRASSEVFAIPHACSLIAVDRCRLPLWIVVEELGILTWLFTSVAVSLDLAFAELSLSCDLAESPALSWTKVALSNGTPSSKCCLVALCFTILCSSFSRISMQNCRIRARLANNAEIQFTLNMEISS